jgi:hypothetical protein
VNLARTSSASILAARPVRSTHDEKERDKWLVEIVKTIGLWWHRGASFHTGVAAIKFGQVDDHAAWRLRRLLTRATALQRQILVLGTFC